MNEQWNRIEEKIDKMQAQNHDMDKRIVRIETKILMIVPMVSLFFITVGDFIKVKVLGIKG